VRRLRDGGQDLLGTAIGSSGVVALAWCAAIALAGYLWARKLYNRDPVR
jgi:ABC-2 type transport system permease protein